MKRRGFVSLTVIGAAYATGCSSDTEAPSLDSPVTLRLADYPSLSSEGGWIELPVEVTDYTDPIFVERLGGDDFRALSAFCNHNGCSVERGGNGYECPCHGSRFAVDGSLEKGPATADLREFGVVYDPTADDITIG